MIQCKALCNVFAGNILLASHKTFFRLGTIIPILEKVSLQEIREHNQYQRAK